MTKKEERELNNLKDTVEELNERLDKLIKENVGLRKELGEFDFEGWNESGVDDDIGNNWHVKWSDYILEFVHDNTFCSQTEETLLYVLERCFNAGIEFANSKKYRGQ